MRDKNVNHSTSTTGETADANADMNLHQEGWLILDQSDTCSNPTADQAQRQPDFYEVCEKRLSRRTFLSTASATAAGVGLHSLNFEPAAKADNKKKKKKSEKSSLAFKELKHGRDKDFHVAESYKAQPLLSWGDPLFPDVPEFDPEAQCATHQQAQFGFNNDFVGYTSLPFGSGSCVRGLLCVNHEYTSSNMMFPGSPSQHKLSEKEVRIEQAAHGHTVVEITQINGEWQVNKASEFNRRITPDTPMTISGPAAGDIRFKTSFSHNGIDTLGTINNCAGSITPWGTVLSGEENIQSYFLGEPGTSPEKENCRRMGIGGDATARYHWGKFDKRWHLNKEPHSINHYGWVIEIDPYDPESKPKKRTALGRFKHEGCSVYINASGHAVAYTGDDQRFEYVYRFVSANKFDPKVRENNFDLLDEGELCTAQFKEDGSVIWHPLVYGRGPLTERNGFHSQADVLIDTRKAADLVGATRMDRPEDVETNPVTGSVFVMLTNNSKRKPDELNPANPRSTNLFGHIIEMKPEDGDHTRYRYTWDFFILAGDPSAKNAKADYHPDTSDDGWFMSPDNCAFDNQGRIWIATDGASKFGVADGVWVSDVEGEGRALSKHFLRTPLGAELCGPYFTPDNRTFFCAVQHPGEGSSFEQPSTRWPDFDDKMPPRPTVMAVTHHEGKVVGS